MTYSNAMATSRQRYAGRSKNAISFRPQERTLGPISNTVMLVVLACLLGLLYLTQVTKTNAYGYTINNLETQATQLKAEHDDLEVTSARLQSLDRVQASAPAKALVAAVPSGVVKE